MTQTEYKPRLMGRNGIDYLGPIESLAKLGNEYHRTGRVRKEGLIVHDNLLNEDPRELSRMAAVAYGWGMKNGNSALRDRLSRINPKDIVISHGRISNRKLRVYGLEEEGDAQMLRMLDDLGFVGLNDIELDGRQLTIPETALIYRFDFADAHTYVDGVFQRERERQNLGIGKSENGYDLAQLKKGIELFHNPPKNLEIEVVGDWNTETLPRNYDEVTPGKLSIDDSHLSNVAAYLTEGTPTKGLTVITKPVREGVGPAKEKKKPFRFSDGQKTKAQGGGKFSSSDERPEEY